MTVGERKATSTTKLHFNPNFTSPTALFRNLAGTGRQNQWIIGDDIGQNSGSTGAFGTIDFTGGSVDAQVNTILVGRGAASPGTGVGTGTLTFNAGVVDVNTLDLGILPSGGGGVGTVNVNDSAVLLVNSALRLTPNGGATSKGTLNLNGGTARVNSITNGGGLNADIVMTSGTLVLTNDAGNASSPILNLTAGDSTIVVPVNAGRTNLFVSNLAVNSTTNNSIGILSLPIITSYPAQYPLISYLNYAPLSSSDFLLGSMPPASPAYQGYISNNTATATLDLVIIGGPAPTRALTWNGNVNGDWNTSTANWLFSASSTTYNQKDLVLFDDSANGTTSVNLTTSLTPGSLTVSNNSKSYTFSGSGTLDGAAGLLKDGSGALTLANTGVNTFAGPVTIQGGALRLSGSADRLPTNCAVTLADVAGAVFDVNGLQQTVASLSGGGPSGGNVSLGSGELSISAGGGTHAGIVSGGGSVVKTGTGTQVFSGANLYAGGTVVTGGRLAVANTSGSGVGSGVIRVETNATFAFGSGGLGGSAAVSMITNNGTVVFDRSDDFTCSIPITGNGNVTKANTNNIVTIPISNTYTGATTINAGALRISNAGALGTADSRTLIQNDPSARLELTGGITLLEPLYVSQKQSAAGYAPCVLNLSGNNTLARRYRIAPGRQLLDIPFRGRESSLFREPSRTPPPRTPARCGWVGRAMVSGIVASGTAPAEILRPFGRMARVSGYSQEPTPTRAARSLAMAHWWSTALLLPAASR